MRKFMGVESISLKTCYSVLFISFLCGLYGWGAIELILFLLSIF